MYSPGMLFTMVSTVQHGNFILDRWPHSRTYPEIHIDSPSTQIFANIKNHFSYFGFYPKKEALRTQQSVFSQSCLLQIFIANQKRLQSVLGIDEDCIFVSRGIFLNDHYRNFPKSISTVTQNNYFIFEQIQEQKRVGVNSISLVWIAKDFSEVEALKHRLSFFLGSIQRKQSSHCFLTNEIDKIIQAKNTLENRINDMWNKQQLGLDQQKIKAFIERCYDQADILTSKIDIFKELQKFSLCVIKGEQYCVTPVTKGKWLGTMGSKFKVPNQDTLVAKRQSQLQNKAILAIQKKLTILPDVLYHDRVQRIVKKIIASENKSLNTLMEQNRDLKLLSVLHTVIFLIENQFAIDIYPFNPEFFLNIYCLHNLPSWETIRRFDKQIFQDSNLMWQLYKFSKYKQITSLTQKQKYIILQKFIKQIDIFIYRIALTKNSSKDKFILDNQSSDEEQKNSQGIQDYLMQVANTGISINDFMGKNSSVLNLRQFIKFVTMKKKKISHQKKHFQWGFYYVEKN